MTPRSRRQGGREGKGDPSDTGRTLSDSPSKIGHFLLSYLDFLTQTHMTIDACIAHAIHSDLDIIEALPEVQDLPVEELESYVERFVLNVQESLHAVITQK